MNEECRMGFAIKTCKPYIIYIGIRVMIGQNKENFSEIWENENYC